MMHLDESLMGPLCKVTSALALASALGLAGCGGGASSASSLSIMLLAAKDAATGFELWKTDGTANGTSLVKDINLGAGNSFPGGGGTPFPSEFVFFNGFWFFSADDGTGPKLWKSDGTQAMLVTAAVSSPRELTVLGNALYFSADDGVSGRELWKTDVNGSTVQVKDIAPGTVSIGGIQVPRSSSPTGLTVFNNTLYFSADDGVNGVELWKSDGTLGNAVLVKDINNTAPGASSSPSGFTVFNNELYFSADGGTGFELWKTNGTPGSAVLVKEINLSGDSSPSGFTVFNNELYFSADDGSTGFELWKTNGTPGNAVLVKDINPLIGDSSPSGFTVFNNALYFSADRAAGAELWKTDVAGTVRVGAVSLVSGLTVFNNALYFSASDGVAGVELWKTDVAGSPVQVKGINNTTLGAPNALTVLNNALLFSADDGMTGRELWRTDGSGTMRVKDICPGSCDGLPVLVILP